MLILLTVTAVSYSVVVWAMGQEVVGLRARWEEFQSTLQADLDSVRQQVADVERLVRTLETAVADGTAVPFGSKRPTISQLQLLLLKAQAEVLKIKVDLVEENRGRARAEAEQLARTLERAQGPAGEELAPILTRLLDDLAVARMDLNNGRPGVVERLELLWRQLGQILPGD
ncbi:MAG: hypothetical protein AB1331_06655 [Bacillota bacterium]